MDGFNKIYWHDGILEDIRLSMHEATGEIVVMVSVYGSGEAPSREKKEVRFVSVESCMIACDINELLDNKTAGNISNGYSKLLNAPSEEDGLVCRLYLSDGYIQIVSRKIEISP